MDRPTIYRWADVRATMRLVERGPNYLSVSVDDNPVNDHVGTQQLAVNYEIDNVSYGVALFRTQHEQYLLRRFTWLIGEDRKLFQRKDNTGRGVIPAPFQIRIENWAMPDDLKAATDRDMGSIRDVLLANAIACEAGQDSNLEIEADQPSVFTWIRVAFGSGRLIQSANFNCLSRSIRSIENRCDHKYCEPVESEKVREAFDCEPTIGSTDPFTSVELAQLPFSLYCVE